MNQRSNLGGEKPGFFTGREGSFALQVWRLAKFRSGFRTGDF